MSANVESMVYVKFDERDVPWHGLGTPCPHAMSSEEALRLAGLNWKVNSQPVFIESLEGMEKIPNTFANVRDIDNKVLGVVTGKYKICQNNEAFDFTDALLGYDVKYETAGSLNGGKRVWILARMPEIEIVGDKVEPYLCFTNSHDGKGAITVSAVSIRVVCQNTLNMALKGATRTWTTRHMGDLNAKKAEAIRTLNLATKYNETLKEVAENLAVQKIDMNTFKFFVQTLIPEDENASNRQKRNIEYMRDDLTTRFLEAPDLENFRFTKWGVLSAVTDFAYHKPAGRDTNTYEERIFAKAIDGNDLVNRAMEILEKVA